MKTRKGVFDMPIRRAAVAGQFYSADPARLRAQIEEFIESSGADPAPESTGGIIAPHAGLVYSGPCAGHAFARLRGKKPARVVLFGPSHRYAPDTAALSARGGFESPLGVMPVDESFAEKLLEHGCIDYPEAHRLEHALEVQLPFLQVLFGDIPIVPLLFGPQPGGWHLEFGRQIAGLLDADDLIVASTDLSHFLSQDEANAIDRRTLDMIEQQDCEAVCRALESGAVSMCGGTGVVTAMACALARDLTEWRLLDYRTSAPVSGDYDRVVGYAALAMEKGTTA
jgi:MEMO1 family protein